MPTTILLCHNDYLQYDEDKGDGYAMDCIEFKELILVSLDPEEKIGIGERYYNELEQSVNICESLIEIDFNFSLKIIATQDKISPEYIQQVIEEYNNGGMKDVDIEMESYYIIDTIPSETGSKVTPKLTNGFITIVEKERGIAITEITSILYTEEEVRAMLWDIRNFYFEHRYIPTRHIRPLFKTWFENNKKK